VVATVATVVGGATVVAGAVVVVGRGQMVVVVGRTVVVVVPPPVCSGVTAAPTTLMAVPDKPRAATVHAVVVGGGTATGVVGRTLGNVVAVLVVGARTLVVGRTGRVDAAATLVAKADVDVEGAVVAVVAVGATEVLEVVVGAGRLDDSTCGGAGCCAEPSTMAAVASEPRAPSAAARRRRRSWRPRSMVAASRCAVAPAAGRPITRPRRAAPEASPLRGGRGI
jgi:hypothetical protein